MAEIITAHRSILENLQHPHKGIEHKEDILPFLADIFVFLDDMKPLLTEISSSLSDSGAKIPQATQVIDSVTNSTAVATHAILDKLEHISTGLNAITKDSSNSNIIAEIKENVGEVTTALQFQDIISQELEHTNKLLYSIYTRVMDLCISLEYVKSNSVIGDNVIEGNKDNSDTVISKMQSANGHTENETFFSQDDIDELFRVQNSTQQ